MSTSTRDPELPDLTPAPPTLAASREAPPTPHEHPTSPSMQAVIRDAELPRVLSGSPAPETRRSQRLALSVLLVGSFLVAAWIASGLWVGIALGTVMAFTAQPLFRSLSHRLGDRRHLAAAIATACMGLVAGGLGALFLYVAVDQLVTIGALIEHKLQAGSLVAMVGEPAARLIDKLGMSRAMVMGRIHHGLEAGSGYAAVWAATVLQEATGAVLGLVMALLTMFYVLLEWRALIVRIERVLPLNPRHTRALILEFRQVGRGVLVGTVASAAVQGALAWVGYAVLGVPQALTWGLATLFASFLPVVGTAMVWGPIGAYLILDGRPFAGVSVLVWGVLVVMMATDYVIRPRLIGRKAGHPLLVMFALLGGIEVLGLAGLIVAPILMSFFLAVLRIYERETQHGGARVHEESAEEA